MYKRNLIALSAMLTLLLLMSGCRPKEQLPPEEPPLEVVIPETTKVMDESVRTSLMAFESNGALVFDAPSPFLDNLKSGDVLVSEPSLAAPYGLLRKVSTIHEENGQVIVETTEARLKDAVHQGEFEVKSDLTPDDLASVTPLLEGITTGVIRDGISTSGLTTQQFDSGFNLGFENEVLFDQDGDESTTDDQVRATGLILFQPPGVHVGGGMRIKVDYDPPFDVDIDIQTKFYAEVGMRQEVKIALDVDANLNATESFDIASYTFDPIVFFVGPVPIVLVPQITVSLDVEGKVSTKLSYEAFEKFNATLGLRKDYGKGFRIVDEFGADFDSGFDTIEPTYPAVTFSAKMTANTRAEMLLYGVVGPFVDVDPYVRLQGQVPGRPAWKLYGGVKASVGISVPVLDYAWRAELLDEEALIAQAEGNTAPVITSPISHNDGAEVQLNLPVAFQVGINDVEEGIGCCELSWSSDKDGFLGTGQGMKYSFASEGERTITVVAKDSDGATVSTSSKINVVNTPPDVTLTYPYKNIKIWKGSPYRLVGSVIDANEPNGQLDCSKLVWKIDNVIFTDNCEKPNDPDELKKFMMYRFDTAGRHTISLTATDPQGKTDTETLTVNVEPCPGDCPPQLSIVDLVQSDKPDREKYDPNSTEPFLFNDLDWLVIKAEIFDADSKKLGYTVNMKWDGGFKRLASAQIEDGDVLPGHLLEDDSNTDGREGIYFSSACLFDMTLEIKVDDGVNQVVQEVKLSCQQIPR